LAKVGQAAAEVADLRRLGENNPGVLAQALARLVDRDPEFADLEAQLQDSLKDVKRGKLVPLRIPTASGPRTEIGSLAISSRLDTQPLPYRLR
jgi:hypothetical protein